MQGTRSDPIALRTPLCFPVPSPRLQAEAGQPLLFRQAWRISASVAGPRHGKTAPETSPSPPAPTQRSAPRPHSNPPAATSRRGRPREGAMPFPESPPDGPGRPSAAPRPRVAQSRPPSRRPLTERAAAARRGAQRNMAAAPPPPGPLLEACARPRRCHRGTGPPRACAAA